MPNSTAVTQTQTSHTNGPSLAKRELLIEEALSEATGHLTYAFLELHAIRQQRLFTAKLDTDGQPYRIFQSYLYDLLAEFKDRNPKLALSFTTAWTKLRWARRLGDGLGMDYETVVNIPRSVQDELGKLGDWDSKTGRLKSLRPGVEEKLPNPGAPLEERMVEFVNGILAQPSVGQSLAYMRDVVEPTSCWYGLRVLDTGVHLSVYVDDTAYTFIGPQMPEWVIEDLARRLGISVKETE